MGRKKSSTSQRNLGIILLFFAALLAVVNLMGSEFLERKGILTKTAGGVSGRVAPRIYKLSQEERLRLATDRIIDNFGIKVEWIKYRGTSRDVRVPAEVPLAVVYQALHDRIRELGGHVEHGAEDLKTGINTLSYSFSGKTLGTIRLIPERKLRRGAGRIAVIIDDFGYNRSELYKGFYELAFPITYSIIPGLKHSRDVAERLSERGKPMMIHLPMEPLEARVEDDGYTLFTDLSEEQIRARVKKAIKNLPHAGGLNNHMGSLATVSDQLLRPAFEEMRLANLFFIDSRTNPNTQAYRLAKQMGLDAGLNDVFLDANDDREWIADKMMHLADLASQKGYAIGIGHPNVNTLKALREEVPLLQQRGFEFVPVTNLLRRSSPSGIEVAQRN